MKQTFARYTSAIVQVLQTFLQQKKKGLSQVNSWGKDVCTRMESFCLSGKMLRGSLTILGYEMFGKKANKNVLNAAAAMELLQSALLIHDDIMDRDTMRRGKDTMFTQYETLGKSQKVLDSHHFGESMGICAGDACFFLAFELLPKPLNALVAREITNVCIAQMEDVSFGNELSQASEEKILNLYRYKTARYTFSLPLIAGATLSGQPKKTIKKLEQLGEHLGILFQLKDDEFDRADDERERKKTFFSLNGKKRTYAKMLDLSKKATAIITELPVSRQWRHLLLELLEYNKNRTT